MYIFQLLDYISTCNITTYGHTLHLTVKKTKTLKILIFQYQLLFYKVKDISGVKPKEIKEKLLFLTLHKSRAISSKKSEVSHSPNHLKKSIKPVQ